MKRSRRFIIVILVLSLLLAIGIGSTAHAVTAYIEQTGGDEAFSHVHWYVADCAAISVGGQGILDLHDGVLLSYTPGIDLSGTGEATLPTATGVVTAVDGSLVTIDHSGIYSFGTVGFRGPQCVFSSGSATLVTLSNCDLFADEFAARGLYTQQGGGIYAEDCTIETRASGNGAAVASSYDSGGSIQLVNCLVSTYGSQDSAAFYSTGGFTISDTKAYAYESEGACLDGGGDLLLDWRPNETYCMALYNSELHAYKNNGVSFAKGPLTVVSDDKESGFAMWGGYLEARGALFYAPNSKALITLYHANTYTYDRVVLSTDYSGSGPGGGAPTDTYKPGARESAVVLNSIGSYLQGDIITDVDEFTKLESTVDFFMSEDAYFEGAINRANEGVVNLTLAQRSLWEVTGTSYISKLNVPTIWTTQRYSDGRIWYTFSPDLSNIHSNGYDVYYDPSRNANLRSQTFRLPEGGWLMPEKAVKSSGIWD